jgi:hypothetical protein
MLKNRLDRTLSFPFPFLPSIFINKGALPAGHRPHALQRRGYGFRWRGPVRVSMEKFAFLQVLEGKVVLECSKLCWEEKM